MGRPESFLADLGQREQAAGPETVDATAETRAVLRGLCGADDAPLEWRSVLGRVEQGTQP